MYTESNQLGNDATRQTSPHHGSPLLLQVAAQRHLLPEAQPTVPKTVAKMSRLNSWSVQFSGMMDGSLLQLILKQPAA
ncbi:MAG: hypothetical protein Q6M54_14800 [Thermostichus sp. DRC_bins_24]